MAQPPERYEVKGILEAIGFLQLIKDRFAANSVTRKEFFALLADFCNGKITDARAVVARANELLQGHPDLVDRFQAFLDPDKHAKQFLERVKLTSTEVYGDVIDGLLHVDKQPGLEAHGVYARFSLVLGSANGDLLRGFAQFLPTMYDLPPCAEAEAAEPEELRPTLKRKHAADPGVGAANCSIRSRAKVPGLDDGDTPTHHPAASYNAGADVVCSSRRLSRAEKPRVHDDPEPKCNPISYAGAVGGSRPSRAKKPRADYGENQCAPLDGAENGTGRGAAAQDDDKNKVSRFRKAWEFETGYSKLVATMARAEELQRESAHGASLEELFPSRECRECLAGMYHDAWGTMRKMLEDDDYIGSALKVILKRLRAKEAAIAEAARSWQDRTRAKQRLNDLVQDRVREERERRGA